MPTSPYLETEIETLKEFYAAINRNDITAALTYLDPEIERIEPEGFTQPGNYRGLAEMRAHLSQGRETWAEGACEPEGFIIAGDRIIVLLHVRVKLKRNMEWVEGDLADVFGFRGGKITLMRTFAEKQQALEWTGVPG